MLSLITDATCLYHFDKLNCILLYIMDIIHPEKLVIFESSNNVKHCYLFRS